MQKTRLVKWGFLVLILAVFGGFGWWWHGIANKVFVSPEGAATIKARENSPVNILLLGYGGGNHDGTYLTDSMMVVHIDPEKSRVTLISIPRDLWVKNQAGTYGKINAAFSDGIDQGGAGQGGKLAKDAVTAITGLQINYFAAVDFDGFVNTIDTLGGVDVKVEVTFDDDQYPIEGKENDLCGHDPEELPAITATASATTDPQLIFPCRYETLHFDAGIIHMDGATALKYVRSRHSAQDGNDFGRSRRQRNLLVAVKQKILAINFLTKAIPFINSLGGDVKTDLTPGDAKLLIQNVNIWDKFQIANLALTDDNYLADTFSPDGQSILIPKAGQDNFTEVKNWISDQLNAANAPIPAIVQVENGTYTTGLAQTAADRLKSQGMQILPPINAEDQTILQTRIVVYDGNIDPKNISVLEQEFGVTSTKMASPSANYNYNVLVILGADYGGKIKP